MSPVHTVYLIGFMGSGKTTAGKRLASMLGWAFADLDKKIEEHAGMKIPVIFESFGEEHFRKLEAQVLRSLASGSDTVVATGGGAPCYEENMRFMLESGMTIYLKLTPAQLVSRLNTSSDERPLIKNLKGEDLYRYIGNKLDERSKWYDKSHYIVDGFNIDIHLLQTIVKSGLGIVG